MRAAGLCQLSWHPSLAERRETLQQLSVVSSVSDLFPLSANWPFFLLTL